MQNDSKCANLYSENIVPDTNAFLLRSHYATWETHCRPAFSILKATKGTGHKIERNRTGRNVEKKGTRSCQEWYVYWKNYALKLESNMAVFFCDICLCVHFLGSIKYMGHIYEHYKSKLTQENEWHIFLFDWKPFFDKERRKSAVRVTHSDTLLLI